MCPKVYAECDITINPVVDVTPGRKRFGEVRVDILTSQGVNDTAKPITLVIKGEGFARVMELVTTYHKPDEALAEKVRASVLADEVEGMSVEEVAAWARNNLMTELEDMAGEK